MFKKLMAKLGVGAATVDQRLDRDAYQLGETMTGVIRIEGGNVEQRISELGVLVMMKAYVNGQEVKRPVQSIPVLKGFTVQPKPYVQEIPFSYQIPHELAVSTPSIQYFLHTNWMLSLLSTRPIWIISPFCRLWILKKCFTRWNSWIFAKNPTPAN